MIIDYEELKKLPKLVVISCTSWKKRIGNLTRVFDSLANNTYQPSVIFLNLSLSEFPDQENDLPKELLEWDKIPIFLNWIPGPNTKTFKKLIPTVKILYRDYPHLPIITVDDDVIYEKDFVKKLIEKGNENPEAIISNNMCRGCWMNQQCVNGAGTLYRSAFFNEFLWKGLVKQVIETNEDDWWYSFVIWLFGSRQVLYVPTRMQFFNEIEGGQYKLQNTREVLLNYWRWLINKKEVIK